MANAKWSPNDKQKQFLEVLKGAESPMTLAEVSEVVGYEVKSGSINTLIGKGLVVTNDTEIECLIVRKDNGKVVGQTKKVVKAYALAQVLPQVVFMKKIRLWLLNRKKKNIQYDLAWLELQLEFERVGLGCYSYLKEKYEKRLNKIMNKIKALEN